MKVCMIAYSDYFHDARIKSYVRTIAQAGGSVDIFALCDRHTNGRETDGRTRLFPLTKKYQGGKPTLYLLSYLAFFFMAMLKVSLAALTERYTAVHVHNMPNIIVFAAIVPRLLGATVILDVHDLMTATYMAKFNARDNDIWVKCLILEQRVSAWFASHVFTADHLQKAYLERVCRIPSAKLTVIMNLPHETVFTASRTENTDGRFRLVYHGTIAKRLGIDIILRAMSRLPAEVPAHLSIYGSGDFLPDVVRLAEELQLGDKVWLSRAFFPTERVPEILDGMDLGIIGNRRSLATDRYMMPVKLLEYAFLKIPVIAPRLEIIQTYFDEQMIKFYEPENVEDLARCIVEMYGSPAERKSLADRASTFFSTRSWKIQGETYLRQLTAR